MTTVTFPMLIGARATAQDLLADIETYDTLVLDFRETLSAAQGFLDEVIRQLLQKNTLNAQVVGARERIEKLLKDAARRREYRSNGLMFLENMDEVTERCTDMTNAHRCILPASHAENPLLMHSIDLSEPTP